MKLSEVIDTDLLDEMYTEGYVRRQTHPTLPLVIWNYSEKAAYDKRWNQATLNCRGLITTDGCLEDMEIVARPWKKFFNYGEGRLKIDDVMPVEVTDKMDGSLGILYPRGTDVEVQMCSGFGGKRTETVVPDDYAIATRGSFDSEQARHATKVWWDRYDHDIYVPPEYTFLFEIIYPSNRIVLNYNGMDDLVLLGAVHIERGYYVGPNEAAGILGWTGPVTQVFPYKNIAEAFAADPRPNAEGFVVRSGTEIVKIKQVDYVELHRIVTNLSPLTLWRRLSAGETMDNLLEAIPDEWHEWLRTETAKLYKAYSDVEYRVMDEWRKAQGKVIGLSEGRFDDISRRTWAEQIVKSKYKAYLFAILDKKPIDQMIWAEIRPNGGTDDTR